jgi:hypothetical protein
VCLGVFIYILGVHTWSSVISHQAHAEETLNFLATLEKILAFYFFIEFLMRIWSAGADGRFQGWKGSFYSFNTYVTLTILYLIIIMNV